MRRLLFGLVGLCLRAVNRLRFGRPRQAFDTRNALVYCPNIGGHRAVYAARFIDYFRRRNYRVYFAYCGMHTPPAKRAYKEFSSPFLEAFRDDKDVHFISIRKDFGPKTDELRFVAALQDKYKAAVSLFVDGDEMMGAFTRQVWPWNPRLRGKNYAVFILIDFIYINMSIRGQLRSVSAKRQRPQYLFHKFFFRHLDLLDGALVSDENLVAAMKPSKHFPIGDIVHFSPPPSGDPVHEAFFERMARDYDAFLARHPGKDVILQFGELENRKGFNFLLRLAAENPDLVLVRAGRTKPSYRVDWDSIANKEKLLKEDRIFEVDAFIDHQPFIDKLFRSINYFLFAYQNHFRTSIMLPLALSYGKPVLVPHVGLLGSRVKRENVGRVFHHRNYKSFAEEFGILRRTYAEYHERVREYYEQEFSEQTFTQRLDAILGVKGRKGTGAAPAVAAQPARAEPPVH